MLTQPPTFYVLSLLLSACVAGGLAVCTWRRRPTPGTVPFTLLMVAVSEWLLAYALRLRSTNLSTKLFWSQVRNVGVAVTPVAWLVFTLQYTGRKKWLKPLHIALLSIVPFLSVVLAWTNSYHGLIWSSIKLDTSGAFPVWSATYGPGFWINAAYTYILLLLGAGLLILLAVRSRDLYQRQTRALLIAALVPLLGQICSTLEVFPSLRLNLTPFAFTLSGVLILWNLLRYCLFNLKPIAHNTLVENMIDGVIVLDAKDRVVDLNPAAERALNYPAEDVLGKTSSEILPIQPAAIARVPQGQYGTSPQTDNTKLTLGQGDEMRTYDLRVSSLSDRHGHFTGHLIVLRDITDLNHTEKNLRRSYDILETRIEERTAELSEANKAFRAEIAERTQVEEALLERTAQLEALREMGLDITAELDLNDLLYSIASRAIELVGGSAGGLSLYRPEQDVLDFTLQVGIDSVPEKTIFRRGEGIIGTVLESGEACIVDDYQQWKGKADWWDEHLKHAADVGVPVRWGDNFLGVLEVMADPPRTFSQADAELLELFATTAAIAIRNAQLHEEIHSRVERLMAVNHIARAVSAALELDELLETVYQELEVLFQPDAFLIALYDEDKNELDFLISIDRGVQQELGPQPLGTGLASLVISHKSPLLIQDLENSDYADQAKLWGTMETPASWLGVPMQVGGRVIGIISVQTYHPQAYDEEDQLLLLTIADQVATAIEHVRLFEEAKRRAAQATLIYEAGQRLSSELEIDVLLSATVSAVHDAFDYHNVLLMLVDEDAERLTMKAIEGAYTDILPDDLSLAVGEGMIGWAAVTGEAQISGDVSKDPHYVRKASEISHSELVVPIKSGEKVIGVLDLQDDAYDAFDTIDMVAMETLAAQIATAIENARLYEEVQKQALEQTTLRKATLALTTTLERDEVIDRILAQLQEVVHYDTATVQLLQDDHLEIVGGRGFPNLEELLGITFDTKQADNPNSEVIRTQAPHVVDDAPTVYPEFRRDPHAAANIRSWLGVPMLIGDHVIGMIALDKEESGFYTQEHAQLAMTFATQAAIAIENTRLFQAEHDQRRQTKALEKAAAAVNSTLDLDQVLDRILEQVEQVVRGDAFNVMMVEDQQAYIVRQRGYKDVKGNNKHSDIMIENYPILKKMAQTGDSILVPDTEADPDWVQEEGREWLRSYIATPIQVGDVTVGFLNVNGTRPGQFNQTDVRNLQAFADHVATAIENAQLYQKLRSHAETLEERVRERTAQLRAQYAQLEAILHSTVDGIIVIGDDGELILANPLARDWLTRTLSPEESERLQKAVQNLATRAGERPEAVLELTGLDLELKAAPISNGAGGQESMAVVAIHDVSHLKALNRMKTHFVTNVSHELRTPIAAIKLFVQLMQRKPDNWQEYVDLLAQQADHQAELVESILEISRVDAGRLEIEPRPTSLNSLTETAITRHAELAQEQNLTLIHRPADSDPTALVDSKRLMQVLNNLVSNAIRYTPPEGTVTISTGKMKTEDRLWSTVVVSDTGIGIPEEELPHIFERFYRGEKPRAMQISGTGLGLAIVKEIVELHGGRVTVESEVDEGSSFTIWLPVAKRHQDTQAKTAPPTPARAG